MEIILTGLLLIKGASNITYHWKSKLVLVKEMGNGMEIT